MLSEEKAHVFSQLGALLASSGQRPGIMLNILLCTRQTLTTKNYLVQNVHKAKAEKSWSKWKSSPPRF